MNRLKTHEDLIKYMLKTYPDVPDNAERNEAHYNRRVGMEQAWKFINGIVDHENEQQKRIAAGIFCKISLKDRPFEFVDIAQQIEEMFGVDKQTFSIDSTGLHFDKPL